eukprot:TRINITY_DN45974_c0_g1_i3.p1 TRINITY_DN45974_c0_g1~~TRINITY_DN45974_c0_g1_i3.p1  ORF type:complete len:111 (+),score=36.97 TRINITY_DN45974_c0_g1_i3:85-417(+)
MIRRPPRSTQGVSSAASDVYKRQNAEYMGLFMEKSSVAAGLKGKSFLKLMDFSQEEIKYFIDLAAELKKQKKEGKEVRHLTGKNVVLLFEKDSTRTRCAFEVACLSLIHI